jgi:thioredoxin-like negative regulator of GroEL
MTPTGYQPLDEHQYHPRLAALPGVGLVLFSTPTCGTCRRVEVLLPRAAPPDTALFHVDVQQSPGLARAFDIFHLPELFLYRAGHFHARLVCEMTPVALGQAIEAALSAPAQEEP